MLINLPIILENCLIREFQEADISEIADMEFDEDVKRYVGIPKISKEEWIKKSSLDLIRGWAIVALPENEFAGRISASRARDRTPGVGELEILIRKKYWGRKLGRQAAYAIIKAAFNELKAKSLRAEVHPENEASIALLEHFNFKYSFTNEKENRLIYELSEFEEGA